MAWSLFGGGGGQPQQQQQNNGGWNGNANMAFDQMQRANTPFQVQQIKDAFGSHNAAMSGLGSTIGNQLNANANRIGQAREQGVQWAQANDVLPFEFAQLTQGVNQAYGGVREGAPDPFNEWLKMNDQFQRARARTQMDIQNEWQMQQYRPDLVNAQQNAINTSRQNQWNNMPLIREQNSATGGLLSQLFGGLGGIGGQLPNQFTTNFGGSGSFVGAGGPPVPFNMSQPNY